MERICVFLIWRRTDSFQQNQTLTMMLTLSANIIYEGACSQYHGELIPLVSIFVTFVVYENHNLAPVGQFFRKIY